MSLTFHKVARNLYTLGLLSLLASCQTGSETTPSLFSSQTEAIGKYALQEKMETLKKTHRFEMKLEYALNDGTKNYRRRYTFTYTDNAYAMTHGEETYGYASYDGGMYTFSIVNGTFEAGPVYNLNIIEVFTKRLLISSDRIGL